MSVEIAFLIAIALAIVMSIGLPGITYLATWLKSRLTQSPKTKTEHTHSDFRGLFDSVGLHRAKNSNRVLRNH